MTNFSGYEALQTQEACDFLLAPSIFLPGHDTPFSQ